MRYGAPTPTANRLLRLLGIVGVMLVLSIIGLAVVFWNQPIEPPAVVPGLAGWGTPITTSAGTARTDRPASWTVRMATHPATGQPEGVVDDPRVYEMVQADYLEGEEWVVTNALTLTKSGTAAQQLETYFADQRLGVVMGRLDHWRTTRQAFTTTTRGGFLAGRQIEVRNFTPDGQEVFLGDSWAGGKLIEFSLDTGAVIREVAVTPGILIATMRYDPARGRWREVLVRGMQTTDLLTPTAGGKR
jgi:hypothetical protein